ncbi:tRNA methyl transferase-domain-containing protein [Lentinula edodes]|uniref:tRNA methyl transferase-domain-containing protein n=1 Tax=Lentinula edodes TaxID=5353 RepID=UPI001E8E03D3|nr:tRNA methyl transferase-domain-containing protein [Lentinula edodes]KAH7873111.1 tRNA methyl transferase-domain-containing protein [Lentinula edodes]
MAAARLCSRVASKRYYSRTLSTHAYREPMPGDKVDYDLSAIFMRNWDTRADSGTDKGCEWEKDWDNVQRVCKSLGIPCTMNDLLRENWNRIFQPALDVWESGSMPNPDVWCNREIKFGALLERLRVDPITGISWFATGHYARKHQTKDQSYYLSSISEQGLARSLFPLSEITKVDYRLETAEKPESMGLCFVGESGNFSQFLNSYLRPNPGPIIDSTMQKVIGHHEGLWTYTIGENAKVAGQPSKMFVSHKDPIKNAIYVVPSSNHQALREQRIWNDSPPAIIFEPAGFRAAVKVRHRQDVQSCIAKTAHDGKLEIITNEPMRGVSPGQVAALWDGDWCLRCGVITATGNSLLHIVDGRFRPSHVAKQVDQLQKKRTTKSTGEGPPERSQLQKPSPGSKIPT